MRLRDFFLIPQEKLNPNRFYFFDGLRAVALLFMVFTHGMKNWINPALETPVTLFFKDILTNIPAPLFLSLVGAAYILSRNARIRKNIPRNLIFRYYLKRSFILLFLAYLYKFIDLVFAVPFPLVLYWRVDILNMISLSLLFLAVIDHLFYRYRWVTTSFLFIAIAFVVPAPFVIASELPSFVPWSLALYFNGKAPNAFFNVFPYAGYVFLGAWLTQKVIAGWPLKPAPVIRRLSVALAVVAVAGYFLKESPCGGLFCDFFSNLNQYGRNYLFVIAASWLAFYFQRRVGFGPLLLLGSHTLIAYWIHAKIIFIYYKNYLGVSGWGTAFSLLIKTYVATLILTFAYINLKKWYLARKKEKQENKTGAPVNLYVTACGSMPLKSDPGLENTP
jgi:hypothetical protein